MVTITRVIGMRYNSVRGGCHRQADRDVRGVSGLRGSRGGQGG